MISGLTLVLVSNAFALPPRQHAGRGAIESIEATRLTLCEHGASRSFALSARSRFYENGHRTNAAALRLGQRVKLYYRNEAGRAVLTEARWENTVTN